MTRRELARLVAEHTAMNPGDAGRAVKAILDAVGDALARGDTVRMPGFGTFHAKSRMLRTGRNPRTGEPLDLPAARAVRFRPGNALRSAVNGPGAGQGGQTPVAEAQGTGTVRAALARAAMRRDARKTGE